MKRAKILYFVAGVAPSAAQVAEATSLAADVVFRNSLAVPAEGALEQANGVAGDVPDRYKDYPAADKAIKDFEAKRKAEAKAVGDKPAPGADVGSDDRNGTANGSADGNPNAGSAPAPAPNAPKAWTGTPAPAAKKN